MINRVSSSSAAFAAAAGAGLASALLFSLVTQATFAAIALAYLSPLPIMIAMIGFGRAAGVTAGAVASLAVGVIAYLQQAQQESGASAGAAAITGATFALALAAPALWLSFLALTQPKEARAPGELRAGAAPQEFHPLERLLAAAIAISATVGVVATIVATARHGGFAAALAHADATLTPVLEALAAETPLPQGIDLHKMARLMALAAPPAIAASTLLMLLANLWLAARAAQISSLLPRPWPDIPRELRLSRIYVPALVVAIGVSFVGGLAGVVSAIVAATLAMGFALQGLAVVHDVSRSLKYRTLLLGFIYFGLVLLAPPWLLIAFAAIGVAESIFSLRARKRNSLTRKT
ncbi:conserved hypothetical protein [Methylocella silvestris BL2]|uniref:DUF2232 domain-containing protein n=1 Tax=Methylocella silvestris (strain DSM 15510 / CIP 108128 / LMG 27833 / NCIMB 13906 / BL2) TaxID=395965 RepID=B8ESI0_METSB|nr:hypothetical protein [Methylocella silvestris]ACK49870.1 conserved hypothetical protein [Methylocella silvestris BL2]